MFNGQDDLVPECQTILGITTTKTLKHVRIICT